MERTNQTTELETKAELVAALEVKPVVFNYASVQHQTKRNKLRSIVLLAAVSLGSVALGYKINKSIDNYLVQHYRGIVCP